MGAHEFKHNDVPVLLNDQCISMYRCLLPRNYLLCQQTVMTAIFSSHMLMSVSSFIRIERGCDGGP